MELIKARWGTLEEKADFFKWLKSKNTDKNQQTYDWLKLNGAIFIEDHRSFFINKNDDIFYENQSKIQDILKKHKDAVNNFNYKINNLGRCVCGKSENIVKTTFGGEFIGCTNWREQGYNHTKIFKPEREPNTDFLENQTYEPSSNYLHDLKKFYNYPSYLKQSILVDYLIMNNQELLADVEGKNNIINLSREKSRKREDFILDTLKYKFEKLHYQKLIIADFTDKKNCKLLPDYIGINNNSIYLIEQKKNISGINENQTDKYLSALKYLISQSGKELNLKLLYIIEEGQNDLLNNIINFQNINDYEFN